MISNLFTDSLDGKTTSSDREENDGENNPKNYLNPQVQKKLKPIKTMKFFWGEGYL